MVLVVTLYQSDGFDRSGTVTLRKLDPSGDRFLPETPKTLVVLPALPAFRFADVLRGDLTGRTRVRQDDLAVLRLSSGLWAIESGGTYVANPISESTSTLDRVYDDRITTHAVEVQEGRIVVPAPLELRPGNPGGSAGVDPIEDRQESLSAMAAARGLTVTSVAWRELSVSCRLRQIRPFREMGTKARCEPGRP